MKRFFVCVIVLICIMTTSVNAASEYTITVDSNKMSNLDAFVQSLKFLPDTVYFVDNDLEELNKEFWNSNYIGYSRLGFLQATIDGKSSHNEKVNGKFQMKMGIRHFDTFEVRLNFKKFINEKALELITPGMSVADKVHAVNKYIYSNYAYSLVGDPYSVYSFVTDKTGVCQAYATLAIALLSESDVKCYYVVGETSGNGHAWIKFITESGEARYFDPTFNDPLFEGEGTVTDIEHNEYTDFDESLFGRHNRKIHLEYEVTDWVKYDEFVRFWSSDSVKLNIYDSEIVESQQPFQTPVSVIPSELSVRTTPEETTPEPAIDGADTVAVSDIIFSDVNPTQWFYSSLDFIVKNDLMVGHNGKFNPNGEVTVAQAMTVITRYVTTRNPEYRSLLENFKSTNKGDWATPYLRFLQSINPEKVNVLSIRNINRPCTREEIAYLVHTFMSPLDTVVSNRKSEFSDRIYLNPIFAPAVDAIYNQGIMLHTKGTNFAPYGYTTRAQMAVILERLMNPDMR